MATNDVIQKEEDFNPAAFFNEEAAAVQETTAETTETTEMTTAPVDTDVVSNSFFDTTSTDTNVETIVTEETDKPFNPADFFKDDAMTAEEAEYEEETWQESLGQWAKEDGAQTAGGIVGGILGVTKCIPFGPWVAFGCGVAGAAGGGFAGRLGTEEVKILTDSPAALSGQRAVFVRSLWGGGEEALYEAGGQLVFKGIVKGYQKGKSALGIGKGPVDEFIQIENELLKHAGKQAEEGSWMLGQADEAGGLSFPGRWTSAPVAPGLDAAKLTGNYLLDLLASFSRGAPIGKQILQEADLLNKEALDSWMTRLIDGYADTAGIHLTPEAIGDVLTAALIDAQTVMGKVGSELYRGVDDLMGQKVVNYTSGVQTKKIFVTPKFVNLKELKNSFRGIAKKYKDIGNIGKTGDEGGLIDRIIGLDDNLTFESAHFLRSQLLKEQRAIEKALGKEYGKGWITAAVKQVDDAMELALKEHGTPEAVKLYRAASVYWKKGKLRLHNRFISKLIYQLGDSGKGSYEDIGGFLFKSGKQHHYAQINSALEWIAKESPDIGTEKVLASIRGGWLEHYAQKLIEVDNFTPTALRKLIATKGTKGNVFGELFPDKAHQRALREFVDVLEKTTAKSGSNFEYIGKMQQAGLLTGSTLQTVARQIGNMGLIFAGGAGGLALGGPIVGLLGAAAVFQTPKFIGRILTSPKFIKLVTTIIKQEDIIAKEIAAGRMGGIVADVIDMMVDIGAARRYGDLSMTEKVEFEQSQKTDDEKALEAYIGYNQGGYVDVVDEQMQRLLTEQNKRTDLQLPRQSKEEWLAKVKANTNRSLDATAEMGYAKGGYYRRKAN